MIAEFWSRIETPNDVNSSDTSGAPRIGRYAKRSMITPTRPASTSARTSATPNGSPSMVSTSTKYGPIMSSSPWAKLIKRRMPKIMASPIAINA
jgi:hypothetical protein